MSDKQVKKKSLLWVAFVDALSKFLSFPFFFSLHQLDRLNSFSSFKTPRNGTNQDLQFLSDYIYLYYNTSDPTTSRLSILNQTLYTKRGFSLSVMSA